MVLDRFSIWISSRLAGTEARADYELLDEVESLADKLYRATTPVVLVTTEIGLGFLPASVPDRRLISVVGLADRILAERAQSVVMMVSGVPLRLGERPCRWSDGVSRSAYSAATAPSSPARIPPKPWSWIPVTRRPAFSRRSPATG